MTQTSILASSPKSVLQRRQFDAPVLFFCPSALREQALTFQNGFTGLVTYAVKANPAREILDNLVGQGITSFDVASPAEMRAVRAACPHATLHYHNPVRSPAEIAEGVEMGVESWSVDSARELEKLKNLPEGSEIAVRLTLPLGGGAYDFGEKFGAPPETCVELLRKVRSMGFRGSLTFHPGTQCTDPKAWAGHIHAAADVARTAGVTLYRLNVGGGFPARREAGTCALSKIFQTIETTTSEAFGAAKPDLVCEPGRALVSGSCQLAVQVRALRGAGAIIVSDGIYGALAELRDMPAPQGIEVLDPKGETRTGTLRDMVVFGPTCDSLDRLRDKLALPEDLTEGDTVLIPHMGAYSSALTSAFNGYGCDQVLTVNALDL